MSNVFFGSNYKIIEHVLSLICLSSIVVEERAVNRELCTLAELRDIRLIVVKNKVELKKIQISGSLGICCGFGLIFDQNSISKFEKGILNIHFGKLPENRGRHPLSWAFLMNEFDIWASLHLLNESIDKGRLLWQFSVQRSLNDSLNEVEEKLISILPENLSIALDRIEKGEFKELPDGIYRPSLAGKLNKLEPAEHSAKYLLNVIRSQKVYGGIEINSCIVTEGYVYNEAYFDPSFFVVKAQDGIEIMVR